MSRAVGIIMKRYGNQQGNIVEVKHSKAAIIAAFGAGAAVGAAGLYAYQNRQRISEILHNKVNFEVVDTDDWEDIDDIVKNISEDMDDDTEGGDDDAPKFSDGDDESPSGEETPEKNDSIDTVEETIETVEAFEVEEEMVEPAVTEEKEDEPVEPSATSSKRKTNRERTLDLIKLINDTKASPTEERLIFIEETLETFNVPKNMKPQVTTELNALRELVAASKAAAATIETLSPDRAKNAIFNIKELLEAKRPKEAHDLFRRELAPYLANEEFLKDPANEDIVKEIFKLEDLSREAVIAATRERSNIRRRDRH